ncbi:hypothetical protein LOCC1_G004464 [Lachnellula occidentalis]|uniref:BTB domain-containing protein n=1 Tax=Lachnellula occidentalis TaxID=215460 RepID=A0A8H8RPT6_9HELO|nr:hypothetical protein LOCC1_G004464 [Lachnellula occidentalis]
MPPKAASKKRPRAESGAAETGPAPIKFLSPGLKPDTRLMVFEQEFHVHSTILKLHSNYFRQFLDSPDKTGAPASALFQYEYVSVVDEDGTWALESTEKATIVSGRSIAKGTTPTTETEAFRKLLCAMYNRPYEIGASHELMAVTRLADFYCALPIVSATLTGALLGSPMFKIGEHGLYDFPEIAPALIFQAQKLRHRVLFRECFIHVVSNWANMSPDHKKIKSDPVITPLVKDGYIKLCKDVLDVSQRILYCAARSPPDRRWQPPDFEDMYLVAPEQNAVYYRSLERYFDDTHDWDRLKLYSGMKDLRIAVYNLLKNNLVLDQTGSRGPGYDTYTWQLLCSDIADDDMPWDASQTDW